jgi:hypothetical protein
MGEAMSSWQRFLRIAISVAGTLLVIGFIGLTIYEVVDGLRTGTTNLISRRKTTFNRVDTPFGFWLVTLTHTLVAVGFCYYLICLRWPRLRKIYARSYGKG